MDEFSTAMSVLEPDLSEEEVNVIFHQIDFDKNGIINCF